MKLKYWLFYLALAILFLTGIGVRLFFVFTQPIWLDEAFSIYFSQSFAYKELLVFFSNDIHPGLYYSYLKLLSEFSNSILVLRVVTSVVPEIAAFLIILKTIQTLISELDSKMHITRFVYVCITFLYFLNPLVIDQSWQLRMYGLVLFFSSVSLYFFVRQLHKPTTKNLIFLILSSLAGIATSYSFLFLAVSYLIVYLHNNSYSKFGIIIRTSLFLLGLGAFFFLLSGYHTRSQLEYASWIPPVNVQNFASMYLTTLGVDTNIQSFLVKNLMQLIFQYTALIVIIYTIYVLFHSVKIKKMKAFFYPFATGLIGTTIILVTSIILPILSHRFFFHTFVPDVSLFLPRSHIIFLPAFWVSISVATIYFINHQTKKTWYIGLSVFTVAVIFTHTLFGIHSMRITTHQDHIDILIASAQYQHVIPDWINYLSISNNNLYLPAASKTIEIQEKGATSKKIQDVVSTRNLLFELPNDTCSLALFPDYSVNITAKQLSNILNCNCKSSLTKKQQLILVCN